MLTRVNRGFFSYLYLLYLISFGWFDACWDELNLKEIHYAWGP